jgi:hypothetical protein
MYEKLRNNIYTKYDGTYSHLVDEHMNALRQVQNKNARKLLKEMLERMEEILMDDICDRYFYGGKQLHPNGREFFKGTGDGSKIEAMWKKDVESFVWLCELFGFKANKKKILAHGKRSMEQYWKRMEDVRHE